MNKTKLEVVRINEDVIATSGVIKINSGKKHMYISSLSGKYEDVWTSTEYNDGISYDVYLANGTYMGSDTFSPTEFNITSGFTPTETGWYYQEGTTYKKCNDSDHSEYNKN